ncbi:FAD-dependent oxidoreductase [Algoriphagus sp. H41]|uniref:FAD-dependent oxidoreductase n=1 Tax=Algoriphagus oliviformis TaxID=2811231 RepID=A0ABS3BZC1_9BACT|nr:FAD-dependent oxidoreductase [Algoriphagus oliviformis]MBN7809729.1 FAD-dependent oxidoreductase [Algoriphagus oliviformis]
MPKNKRIAVLGAGGLGACLALELAQRGYQVTLFEAHSEAVRKASFVNEGKIHLGFIYAMDRDFHTSQQMIIGAVHFMDYLKRWISIEAEEVISTPFHYCIHKGSLASGDQLEPHYAQCAQVFGEVSRRFDKKYLGLFDKVYTERLPKSKIETIVNPEYFEDVFLTSEYAVEPRAVAEQLRKSLGQEAAIQLLTGAWVKAVVRREGRLEVRFDQNGLEHRDSFDEVVNCTWNSLLAIDQTLGIEPLHGSWSFRYKFGNKILIPFEASDFPSCTMVQGPFGDSVNFRDRGGFFSWYPIGRTGWSEERLPPDWDGTYSPEYREEIFQASFEQLRHRVPALRSLSFPAESVDPAGGVIFALGNTDVEDADSKLHTRHEVGIRSFDGYHTVNTGKYTLIPYLAVKTADRLEGIS